MNCYETPSKVKSCANHAVRRAIKEGRLAKPETCSICGADNPIGHHEDYTKPLEVQWLCRRCHMDRHIVISAEHRIKYVPPQIQPVTLSVEQAAMRHDVFPRNLARMCLRGQTLAKKHGGWSKVPEAKKNTALQAKKVGKAWAIPVSELDRIFLF